MKKSYTLSLFVFSTMLLTGCSKDFLRNYEDRLIGGKWHIYDIDRRGWGSSGLAIREGEFIFHANGKLDYFNRSGEQYDGTWEMRKRDTEEGRVRTLQVTVVNFTTQDIRSVTFDDVEFTGTNRFRAHIYNSSHRYVYRFRR